MPRRIEDYPEVGVSSRGSARSLEQFPEVSEADYVRTLPEGKYPVKPLNQQHPEIGAGARAKLMNVSASPATAKRYLESKGFEVIERGGYDLSIRRPGGPWYVLDPAGFDWQDVTDIGGDIATGVGAAAGATAAIPASVTGPGAIAAGMGGAALGAGGVESLKQGLGGMLGLPATAGEALGAVSREAAFGAASVPIGKVISKGLSYMARGAGKGLQALRGTEAVKRVLPQTREEIQQLAAGMNRFELEQLAAKHGVETVEQGVTKAPHEILQKIFEKQPGADEMITQKGKDLSKLIQGTKGEMFETQFRKLGSGELRDMTARTKPVIEPLTLAEVAAQYSTLNKAKLVQVARKKFYVPDQIRGKPLSRVPVQDIYREMWKRQEGVVQGAMGKGAAYNAGAKGLENVIDINARRAANPTRWRAVPLRNVTRLKLPGEEALEFGARKPRHVVGGLFDIAGRGVRALPEKLMEKYGKKALGLGSISSITRSAAAGAGIAGLGIPLGGMYGVGKGLSYIGKQLMRDVTGAKLTQIALRRATPEPVKQILGQALQALRERGVTAYRTALWMALQQPAVAEFLSQGNEAEAGALKETAGGGQRGMKSSK
jgi:hypothetical protein